MQPKNAPKTPISHLQRRRRFQLRLDQHPQRRQRFQLRLDQHPQRQCRFQSRLGRRPQRRWRFQTTGPPGRQSLTTAPAGGGWAWSGDRWADDVTNVVKPTRFKSPREDLCYKRRQSASKNLDFQRKSRRIDDVCNNTQRSAPKSQHDKPDHIGGPEGLAAAAGPGQASRQRTQPHMSNAAPPVWRAPEGPEGQAAVPVGGGGAWPGFEATRRAKLAARTARGRAAAHGHTKQPGPTGGPSGARNTRGAQATSTYTKTPTRNRVGVSEPPVGIEPTTYSLRVNRSAD